MERDRALQAREREREKEKRENGGYQVLSLDLTSLVIEAAPC